MRFNIRGRLAVTGVVLATGMGVFAGAVLGQSEPDQVLPAPDMAQAVASAKVDGYTLSLAPARNADGQLCLVVQDPAGPPTIGCGASDGILKQGAQLRGTDHSTGVTTVWGYAAQGETAVSLGDQKAAVGDDGFYAVAGPSDGVLSVYRNADVVSQTDLSQTPAVPEP